MDYYGVFLGIALSLLRGVENVEATHVTRRLETDSIEELCALSK